MLQGCREQMFDAGTTSALANKRSVIDVSEINRANSKAILKVSKLLNGRFLDVFVDQFIVKKFLNTLYI